MMRLLLFPFVLFFGLTFDIAAGEFVIDFTHPKFARLDKEGKKLLSEYAQAYPKIKGFYENLRMDVVVVEEDYPSEASLEVARTGMERANWDTNRIEEEINRRRIGPVLTERQYVLRYRADGYARVDSQTNRSDAVFVHVAPSQGAPQQRTPDFIPDVNVALFTPTIGYALSKSGDPSKQYFSLNAKRDSQSLNADDVKIPSIYFFLAPFCTDGTPLEKIVFQPPLIQGESYPGGVEYVRQNGILRDSVVEIKSSLAGPEFKDLYGEIKIDGNSWGIKETYKRIRRILPDGSFGEIRWTREKCTYDGVFDGVPLLKTYQRSFGIYDPETQEEKLHRKIFCEVTRLVPGPPDLSEFDVAQFLPPGAKVGENITPAILSPARIAAVVIGVIIIILGIYLKIRDARKG